MARRLIVPSSNNFVERPWGGTSLRALKALCPLPDQVEVTGSGLGESFELAAFDDDREAARHASTIANGQGIVTTLAELIRQDAEAFLGKSWVVKYGCCIPLLPKFLNVRELLSVQGHPPGHTEAYVVVDAEPGATIRLGFRRDIDAREFRRELEAGLSRQRELSELLGRDTDWFAIQRQLASWLADRDGETDSLPANLLRHESKAVRLLESLKHTYWYVLDAMNEIELTPGLVIHNANPQRILDAGRHVPAAEVHALGNPQRREFTMLEIRRPGPTLRAWDNVRFPMRDTDIAASLEVLNLNATRPEEFICARRAVDAGGRSVSVDSPYFRIEHIEAAGGESFEVAGEDAHCLHVLAGSVEITTDSQDANVLMRGASAFVPFGVKSWRGRVRDGALHLVKVHLP